VSRYANAGELRTKIRVFRPVDEPDPDGYTGGISRLENVFDENGFRYCKWVNAHGTEVYEARQAGVTEPATLTLRYTPKITTTCLIYREQDPEPYEVISLNDVENRHVWLEVRVQRKAAAK